MHSTFTLLTAAIMMTLLVPVGVSAQEEVPSKEEILDVKYSGPVFLDAFWTDRTTAPPADTSLDKVEVGPGEGASVLAVVLVNRGQSDITAITGILNMPSGFSSSTSGLQAQAAHDTIVEPGETFTLFFEIDVLKSAKVRSYTTPLTVQYSRILESGQPRTNDLLVTFRLTGKVILDAEAVTKEIVPGGATEVTILINNKGSVVAPGVVVTVSTAGDTTNGSSMSAVALGQKVFDLGTIPVNGSAEIRPTIYASNLASETAQAVNLQVSYGNAYGVKQTVTIPVGLAVLPRALEPELSITTTESPSTTIIAAGTLYDYKFVASNNAGKPLSDVLITLKSQSDSIRILGDSKWTVKTMDEDYAQEFSTQIFAPTDMIGDSATFNVSVRYLSSGQTKTDSFDLGAYIDGEISIRAYDIAVNYIGGSPNIVGNLLNEGNTVALFTTIELVSADNLVAATNLPPQQYLGDLEENSPLPFSIPIDVGNADAGTYPVSLRVTYKDNLREQHILDVSSEVRFEPQQTEQSASVGTGMDAAIPVGIGVAAAAAIAILVIRARKKAALRRTIQERKQDDIESLLDSQRLEKKPEDHK